LLPKLPELPDAPIPPPELPPLAGAPLPAPVPAPGSLKCAVSVEPQPGTPPAMHEQPAANTNFATACARPDLVTGTLWPRLELSIETCFVSTQPGTIRRSGHGIRCARNHLAALQALCVGSPVVDDRLDRLAHG
jgi:hypothetical protein